MTITLKEETVVNRWSMLIDEAAASANEALTDIQARLRQAQIPGKCTWSLEEVKSGGWLSSVRREFLVVRLDQFSDYRSYIGVRTYGSHLDLSRFLTVEPGFFKKKLASSLGPGDWAALSTPKNILLEQDLSAWVTVVHHCVVDAARALVTKLGQDPSGVRRQSKGFLEVW